MLQKAMQRIKDYDYVLIDCGPYLDPLNFNVYLYADEALIPVNAEFLSMVGTAEMVRATFSAIQQNLGHELKINGIVATFYDKRTRKSKEIHQQLIEYFQDKVYQTAIRVNTRLSEAPSHQKTIFEYDPRSKGAQDFAKLASEFIERG